jgi:hypothetical protein
MSNNKEPKVIYTIVRNGKQTYWHRIGSAFVNKDGSLNLILFALPVNGELHVRDAKVKESAKTAETAAA